MSQYIGRRIVPVHGGVWDNSKDYEELTIVLNEASGDSYISRRPIPAGTAIGDKNYWMQYSIWSAQVTEALKEMRETDAALRDKLSVAESRMENRVVSAENLTNANKSELNERMDGIDKRLDANVAASTDKDADYAAEVVDARVDSNGTIYENLGASIRRNDKFFRMGRKPAFGIAAVSLAGERGNESTASVKQVTENGKCVAVDLTLNYVQNTEITSHWIRSSFNIPLSEFQESYDGKQLVYQIFSSVECYIYIAWGYLASFKEGITLMKMVRLQEGYNEFLLDCSLDEFKALEIPDNCKCFYLHYLFGDYREMHLQPPSGTHYFRFSMFAREDMGKTVAGSGSMPEAVFAGSSKYSVYSAEAAHSAAADQAVNADLAAVAQKAERAVLAGNSECAMKAGMENTGLSLGYQCRNKNVTVDKDTGVATVTIDASTVLATDAGFSFLIGAVDDLRGHDLLVYRDEKFAFTKMALNAGNYWGGGTYLDIQDMFVALDEVYSVAAFDKIWDALLQNGKAAEDFEGKCYFMIYRNDKWDLAELGEGTVLNHYAIYKSAPDGFVYDRNQKELQEMVTNLGISYKELREECEMLDSERDAMQDALEAVQKGNVLWGKKWVACGDSFTEGDFSGYTDANGLSGKNSPELYDSEKKMYKTYPWWIGERNHMTIVNEAKCGSIMPLDKTYVDNPENVAVTTRNPFSLTRYKAIPADADYITLWFGINDSSHTYLGAISDTTNETFYGAWNVVLRYLIENHPFAKIGIIVTERGNADYRNALREIAKKWGIPYLDMMGDEQVPVIMYRESELGLDKTAGDLRYNAFRVGTSNAHPNVKAHEYQSTFIENFLRSL